MWFEFANTLGQNLISGPQTTVSQNDMLLEPTCQHFVPKCLSRDPQDDLSGADIKALCTEAGLLALRERRMRVTHVDFKKVRC